MASPKTTPMEVLLLTDIPGIGKKNDLLVVKNGFALNHLLPARKALVVTPNVRKRYAEQIKQRALERETERELLTSLSTAIGNKTIHITAKASKAGKLYAAITEAAIASTLKTEYSVDLPESAVTIDQPIKSIGKHTVMISLGAQSQQLKVEVKPETETAKK